MDPKSASLEFESVFVARQPVFDRDENIWGYELLFRHSAGSTSAELGDEDRATSQVIADGFVLAGTGLKPGNKMLINFPRNLLLEDAGFALPPDMAVVEILETVEPEPEVLAALTRLKDAGYTLALDDYVGQPGFEPILEMADIVKVDILGRAPKEVIELYRRLEPYGCTLLAEKIETPAIYKLTRELGFSLFQGFFFCKPEVLSGSKVSSGQLARLQLLNELGREDFEVGDLASIITADISLSYRLLRYINSAAFSTRHKIENIRQAIVMLGRKQLAQWLRVVVMSDLSPTQKAGELALISAKRARFLELLAGSCPAGRSPETMFLLGLFSLLDAIMGQPMDKLMEELPLEDEIKQALLGEENEARSLLTLADRFDKGDWQELARRLDELNLDARTVAALHARALAWADEIMGSIDQEGT